MGGRGRRRSGGDAGRVALELPYAVIPASGADGRLRGASLRRLRRRNDRRNRAGPTGDDQGEASPQNRVGGRRAFEGGARSPASPGPRNLLHRQFGEDAGHGGIGPAQTARVDVSTPCRCCCQSCCLLAESCDRALSVLTTEERLAAERWRPLTSDSPDPEVAPAQVSQAPELEDGCPAHRPKRSRRPQTTTPR